MNPHYFPSTHGQLFGVYHRARGSHLTAHRAIVVCPPIGQEYIRSHWCLRLLAGQLARKGMHVLRFDYSGMGDSSGTIDEIFSMSQWQKDIESSIGFLRTKAGSESVMLLGLRTGASMATRVARASEYVNSLLMWEPVHHGGHYLNEKRALHSEMLDMWICEMETEDSQSAEELLGSRYSRPMLDDLEKFNIDWQEIEQPHFVFDVQANRPKYDIPNNPMRKIDYTEDDCSWNDLKQLETAWLRPQTTRMIVDRSVDIFTRLQKYGVLQPGLIV